MPNSWVCALEPQSPSCGPCAATIEAMCPRAWAPQQETPPPWEAHTLQLQRLEKNSSSNEDGAQPEIKKKILKNSRWLPVYCFLEPNFLCLMRRLMTPCGKCARVCGRCSTVFTYTKRHTQKYLRVNSKLLTLLHLTALFLSMCRHTGPWSTAVCISLDHEFKSHGLQLWCVRN